MRPPPSSTLFPYTTLFRSVVHGLVRQPARERTVTHHGDDLEVLALEIPRRGDRKSTRLNSSHVEISYAVFCLKKKMVSDSPSGSAELLIDRFELVRSSVPA